MRCCFPKMDPMEVDSTTVDFTKPKKRVKQIQPMDIDKPIKKRKKTIPKSLRMAVWNTYIGDSIGKTKCPICQHQEITQMNFHCAHVIAEANGGETNVSNLRPTCASCNLSMGKQHLEDFKRNYFD